MHARQPNRKKQAIHTLADSTESAETILILQTTVCSANILVLR
jgi:hypothetical protein